jgi:hypothetical protein
MSARPTRSTARSRASDDSLLDSLLGAPDRDHCPGARPVVSISQNDERAYLDDVDACAVEQVTLSRRGAWHGEWAVLDLERSRRRAPRSKALHAPADEGAFRQRWYTARPIVLHGAAAELLEGCAAEIADACERHAWLKEPGGLKRWIATRSDALSDRFHASHKSAPFVDPERDLERVFFEAAAPPGRSRKRIDDLWVKSGWLSTHEDEDSLRVRVSFGREKDDDASGDLLRHRLVAELAAALLPESALVTANPRLADLVDRLCTERALFTQHIAYWNSPDGGALFHHDAFSADSDVAGDGQLGVCYLQLTGRTAWLALSSADLAHRIREFAELLAQGELGWVRQQLFGDARAFERFRELARDPAVVQRELALPGCGRFFALVNRGPEFTSFLADAGHAAVLSAGDAILLPNHGLTHTALHSVFCASEETAYSLSLAIRLDRDRELPIEPSIDGKIAAARERSRAARG